MKRLIIGVVVIALVGVGGYSALGGGLPGTAAAPTPTPEPVVRASEKRVVADGRVVPVRSAAIGLQSGGVVAQVLVAEGDHVAAGQVLLQLENAKQMVAVLQAEAGLKRAQAYLDQVKAGARPQEIAAAQAGVEAAQAQLAKVRQGARADELAAAEASVAAAEGALKKVLEGADESQVILVKADLANAEAALKQAQAAYDKVAWSPDVGARPEALRLEQATNNYYAAQSRLDSLLSQPGDAAVAGARAQLQQAEAARDRTKAGAQAADIAAAEAAVRQAQAQLQLVEAGARPEAIAAAEADVATAKAAVEQAKVALADTELKAPFAGTVASLDVAAGEQVAPGNPVVRLADLSAWQIETIDLTELDVIDVREGDPATLTFDAIPGLDLPGEVVRIKAMGQSRQGDITYTVTIKPATQEERLRWNMTVAVTIEAKR